MVFGKGEWRNFEQGIEKEWLLTNGIGGYASSTIIGVNTRRYHGLLIASLKHPVNRHLILSKLDEVIEVNNERFELGTNKTPDSLSNGFTHLQTVEVDKVVNFKYIVKDIFIEKKITMVYGKNTVVIVYNIINGVNKSSFKIYPLVNFRDHHGDSSRSWLNFSTIIKGKQIVVKPNVKDININLAASDGNFTSFANTWFNNMEYQIEKERGLQSVEEHYIPGYFEINLEPEEEKTITVIASIDPIDILDGEQIIQNEETRINSLVKKSGLRGDFAKDLVMAADKFIVERESTGAKTIIAGYPWFTDWGRDTMIALPGIALATRRFEDAREIIMSFVKYIKKGLVPNMFPDEGQEPIYNTVDASLWFFEAVFKYAKYTKDYDFIEKNIYPKMKEIIDYYKKGTEYNIKMDDDGLISAGDKDIQLTWMDAKIGNFVVTPRYGKAVEINALWYNALRVMGHFAKKYNDNAQTFERMARNVKRAFDKFWNYSEECLYDVINDDFIDGKIRPNQIFAVSLSHPVIEGERAKKVVDKVFNELYTSMGLRSLSPKDREYVGIYLGDQLKRDTAYHEGTVWGWLIGPFITAYKKVYGHEHERVYKMFVEPIKEHLKDAGVGSISEIFDGDEPLIPRGCFAQAWSVGEVLRAYVEDIK